jgi:hypothetical protein
MKLLAAIVGLGLVSNVFGANWGVSVAVGGACPPPVVYYPATPVVVSAPVVYAPVVVPAPVVYAPVVAPAPVVVAPAPVYYSAPPVCAWGPVVSFNWSNSRGYHGHHFGARRCR